MTRLTVAVPVERYEADPQTGAGRVWTTVLELLRRRGVRIEPRDPRARARLWRRRDSRPDVWLTPGDTEALDVTEPVVAVLHGVAWPIEDTFLDYVPGAFSEGLISATEAMIASASHFIVPSKYTRRGLLEGYGVDPERIFVIPHGVDVNMFSPRRSGGLEIVASALGERAPYVLFASIPSIRQKNLSALKAAMGSLAARGFPHALVIAGGVAGGESPEELEAIRSDLPGTTGRVAWLGHVDDEHLSGLMAECAAFCLPSLFESFGLTALEAMAAGAPVVVSDRGALPEVVGDSGVAVEPTPVAIERAVGGILENADLAARIGAAGRARATTMTWDHTADKWLAGLRQAAVSGRGDS